MFSHTQPGCFCGSTHLFTLAALYLHTETLKPWLGSHISRPRDIHPDFGPNRDGWLSEEPWDGLGQLQNQEAQRGDKLGFYGLAEQPNAPHRDVRKYSMHTHINMCIYVCVQTGLCLFESANIRLSDIWECVWVLRLCKRACLVYPEGYEFSSVSPELRWKVNRGKIGDLPLKASFFGTWVTWTHCPMSALVSKDWIPQLRIGTKGMKGKDEDEIIKKEHS